MEDSVLISSYYQLYFIVNIMFVILLAFAMRIVTRAFGERTDVRLFRAVAMALITVMVSDAIWCLIDGRMFLLAPQLNMLCNVIYMMASGVVGYTWLIYIQYKLHNWEPATFKQMFISAVPMLVLIFFGLTNSATGWLFKIDKYDNYYRGEFFFIYFIVFVGYFVATLAVAVMKRVRETKPSLRDEYGFIIVILVLPLIGALMRYYFFSVPTVFTMTTISLLLIMTYRLSMQVSSDSLTGMNNRKSFDEYLEAHMMNLGRIYSMHLVLMDVDDFKSINDVFGHVEGDKALRCLADVIKKACGGTGVFCARFGGDEFVLASKDTSDKAIRGVMERINSALSEMNESEDHPYKLTVSMGMGVHTHGEECSPQELIRRADNVMYSYKEEKKNLFSVRSRNR